MRYKECTKCRRNNSHLCENCHNLSLLLTNDSRKFYYINSEGDHRRGPVAGFLLPYMDVCPESYVWTSGMKNWDFAGNVLDRRALTANFEYCPMCNGQFESLIIYPNDREILYRCRQCGFEFAYGGTRAMSKAQMEYSNRYYSEKHVPVTVLPRGHKIRHNTHDVSMTITVESMKSVESGYIVYDCTRTYDGGSNKSERIEMLELFIAGKDSRHKDGRRIITCRQCNYGQMEMPFYDYVAKSCGYPLRQVFEYFSDEYGLSENFIIANDTRYFIKHNATPQTSEKNHKSKPSFLNRIVIGACAAGSGYCFALWAMHDLNASHAEYAIGGFALATLCFICHKFNLKRPSC